MPTLGNYLDFAKYEARQVRAHQLGAAPSSPVTGQLYYNTADNTLYWWDGTGWVSARGGAAATPPATTGALGTIQLAGDLAGTATSPQIAAGVVTDAEVAAANKDGAAGTVGMRSLGTGAAQAMPGNRTLDAITAPAADLSLNSKKIIGLADPIAATDAANKQYVDNLASGLAPKDSVRAASTGNLTLSAPQTVDGIALIAGDRVLVKDQTTPAANGIYLVAAGAWTRTTDADTWAELPGAFTFVEQGTVNAETGWVCSADQGGTLNTTAVTFVLFTSAGTAELLLLERHARGRRDLDVHAGRARLPRLPRPDRPDAGRGDRRGRDPRHRRRRQRRRHRHLRGLSQTANTIRTTVVG